MTMAARREFLPALREVERRLSVPIPERVRILRELAYDLEQLRTGLMASGLSAEAARARALEAIVPDRIALEQLDDLHAPIYRRLTRHMRDDRLRLLERTALALSTAVVLCVGTLLLLGSWTFRVAPHLVWPVLCAGALLFAVIVANVFRLWIKGDHRPPRFGVGMTLGLSATTLWVGLACAFIDTFQVTASISAAPAMVETLVLQWLRRDAALLSVSILIALAGALAWFVMTQWLTAVSAARRDVLGFVAYHSEGESNDG